MYAVLEEMGESVLNGNTKKISTDLNTSVLRMFHSMRASRQTELQREFPMHVACSRLGNSPRIAQQTYFPVSASTGLSHIDLLALQDERQN
jgi:hypothetical protein